MNHDDLHDMGMREIGLAIQAGELSSEAVTERQFERIAQLDGRLKSYALLMKDGALAAARQADREIAQGQLRGPLHGVPVAVRTCAGPPTRRRPSAPRSTVDSRPTRTARW